MEMTYNEVAKVMVIRLFEIVFLLICAAIAVSASIPAFISGSHAFPDLTPDPDLAMGLVFAAVGAGLFLLALKWTSSTFRDRAIFPGQEEPE